MYTSRAVSSSMRDTRAGKLVVDVAQLRSIFGPPDEAHFVAILPPSLCTAVDITGESAYTDIQIILANATEISDILPTLQPYSHIFCITIDAPFASPSQSSLSNMKLGVLPMFSTGFSLPKLERALEIIMQLDYDEQYRQSRQLIAALDEANRIVFQSREFKIQAVLELSSTTREVYFFNQSGPIAWGHQSVLPGGEVSLLTNRHGEYAVSDSFALDGELELHGYPILHRGGCTCGNQYTEHVGDAPPWPSYADIPSVLHSFAERQTHIFKRLTALAQEVVIAEVRNGLIEAVRPLRGGTIVADQLRELFKGDSRYRKIHEIGFGLNPCEGVFLEDNFLPNEMRRGVHFGLGLTPYTEFHLDLACTTLSIITECGTQRKVLLGDGDVRTGCFA